MPEAIVECRDFSEFQEALRNMRRADDIIVNTLNAALPTYSFHPNGEATCKEIQQKFEEAHHKRTNVIQDCLGVTAERVKQLKEQRANNANDDKLSKVLRTEQTKLRMLQVELTVEDLIQERSHKVIHEKCRRYLKFV